MMHLRHWVSLIGLSLYLLSQFQALVPVLADNQVEITPPSKLLANPVVSSPNLTWYTFLGSEGNDRIDEITFDSIGRAVVIGSSDAPWGEPINPHSGGRDVFVAKFSLGGNLLWHTFIGGSAADSGVGVVLDEGDRIYITGTSDAPWGDPFQPYNGQRDIFLAQLSINGLLKWHTFFGSAGDDTVNDLAIDRNISRLILVGMSDSDWDRKPLTPFGAENEAFALAMELSGRYSWHTFLGGEGIDSGQAVVSSPDGDLYVAGSSTVSWGETIINAHTASRDGFLAKLSVDGRLEWTTFLGTIEGSDSIESVATDSNGNVFVAGYSWASWGEPVDPFTGTGFFDGFAAKLTATGELTWHTFFGSDSEAADADAAYDIVFDVFGRIYVVGDSRASWGEPLDSFNGERDTFVMRLEARDGSRVWQTFLGGPDFDYATAVATDENANIFLAGYSQTAWTDEADIQPLNDYAGQRDGVMAVLPPCLPRCAVGGESNEEEEDEAEVVAADSQDGAAAADNQTNARPDTANDADGIAEVADSSRPETDNPPETSDDSEETSESSAVTSEDAETEDDKETVESPAIASEDAETEDDEETSESPAVASAEATETPDDEETSESSVEASEDADTSDDSEETTVSSAVASAEATETPDDEGTSESPVVASADDEETSESSAVADEETDDNEAEDSTESQLEGDPPDTTDSDTETTTSPPLEEATEGDASATTAQPDVATPTEIRLRLTDLGYDEVTVQGLYGVAHYDLTVPKNWQLSGEAFIRLDTSFLFNALTAEEMTGVLGNIIVSVDGQIRNITPLQEATVIDQRYRVPLPLNLLNDPEQRTHRISIALDSSSACAIPHDSRLIIHPNDTFISLTYAEQPLTVDLAQYPHPFDTPQLTVVDEENNLYRFESSQLLFVLPEQPTQAELQGAVAIAARMGNQGVQIDLTTDQNLLDQIAAGSTPNTNYVVIGTPDSNKLIEQLNEWQALPTPFREPRLNLTLDGPPSVQPNDEVSYKLTVTNSTTETFSSLLLSNLLSADVTLQECSGVCSETANGQEVSWFIDSLAPSQTVAFSLTAKVEATPSASVIENSALILNDSSEPLSAKTNLAQVGTIDSADTSASELSISSAGSYFLARKGWVAGQDDGVVQGVAAPWNSQRAILIITSLNDTGVAKAGQVMAASQSLPGLVGSTALIDQVQPYVQGQASEAQSPRDIQATLGQLGYTDQVVRGTTDELHYDFNVPAGWSLTNGAALNLKFSHSQLLNFTNSSLRVLLNDSPLAEMMLTQATANQGEFLVNLPTNAAKSGQDNRITVQTQANPLNLCSTDSGWVRLSGQSTLNLAYQPQQPAQPSFELFPRPFSQAADLANLMVVLPQEPVFDEWAQAIRLVATIGNQAAGQLFTPQLVLGEAWSELPLEEYHLIAIGRPTRNSLLRQVNDQLLQPFSPHSDLIERQLNGVVLRLQPDTNLGVLQLMASPFNNDLGLLVVSGTSNQGVVQASELLAANARQLGIGDLAFVDNEESTTIDTRRLLGRGVAQAVADSLADVSNTVPQENSSPAANPDSVTATAPQPPPSERPRWLVLLVGVAAVLIVFTLTLAYLQAQRAKRS